MQEVSRETDTESEDTTPGRDSWKSARSREAAVLSTLRSRGRGKRRADRGVAPPRSRGWSPRLPTDGKSRRDRDPDQEVPRDDRAGVVNEPTDPGHPHVGPYHRVPALVGAYDSIDQLRLRIFGNYPSPLNLAPVERPIHVRPAITSEDGTRAVGRGVRQSGDGWTEPGGRESPRRLSCPILVSHTTNSFVFTSAHPFFPDWVRIVSAHNRDPVWKPPCSHGAEEEAEMRKRRRRAANQRRSGGTCGRSS